MSKTVLAEVGGFTPVIDEIAKEYGLVRSAVFGTVWRYCQMKDGVCKASMSTIAEHLGIDRATVLRHAQALCDSGYLKDLSPDLKNKPHIYKDTGKAGLNISILGVAHDNKTVAQNNSQGETVAQNNKTVAESRMRKGIKKEKIMKEEKSPRATPARAPDPLFDAIVKVCACDPTIKENGSSIGKVRSALLKAQPPYTAEEVLAWGESQTWRHTPPSIWQLRAEIGAVRAPNGNGHQTDALNEWAERHGVDVTLH